MRGLSWSKIFEPSSSFHKLWSRIISRRWKAVSGKELVRHSASSVGPDGSQILTPEKKQKSVAILLWHLLRKFQKPDGREQSYNQRSLNSSIHRGKILIELKQHSITEWGHCHKHNPINKKYNVDDNLNERVARDSRCAFFYCRKKKQVSTARVIQNSKAKLTNLTGW